MKTGDLKKRLRRDRPMKSIGLRVPEDLVDDLKRIAPRLGFTSYQALLRAYVGQGLRRHLEAHGAVDDPPERQGDEEPVLLDPLEHRLLRGLAGLATSREDQDDEIRNLLRRYLDEEISLGKVAHSLGVSRFELTERFERLEVPLRIGPATLEEARDEVRTARGEE
jgi:AraC-like DNA-binding protein